MNGLFRLACINLFLAVGLGAIGGHAVRDSVSEAALETYKTGSLYHLVNGVGALALLAIPMRTGASVSRIKWAVILLLVGCWIFGGSLYLLATTGVRVLGAITPIGGVCFLIGWILAAFALPQFSLR